MFFKYLGGKLIYSGCIRRNVAVEERKYISKTCEFPLLLPAATVFQLQSKQRRKLKGKKFKSKKKMWSYDERLRPPLSYQQLGGSFSGVAKPIFFESSTNIKRREGESQPLKWKNFFQKEVFMKLWQVFLLLKLFFDVLRPGLSSQWMWGEHMYVGKGTLRKTKVK